MRNNKKILNFIKELFFLNTFGVGFAESFLKLSLLRTHGPLIVPILPPLAVQRLAVSDNLLVF